MLRDIANIITTYSLKFCELQNFPISVTYMLYCDIYNIVILVNICGKHYSITIRNDINLYSDYFPV